jgi:hypothetical protein
VYDACGPGAAPDDEYGHPLLARVDPALGPRLAALGCALVWATTWGAAANTLVAPRLGLPPLPVVDWAEAADEVADGVADPGGRHWKTRPLVDWAAGRPFVWLDDEITDADHVWVAAHHPAPALLHRVDARDGITDADLATLADWIRGVAEGRRTAVRDVR